MVDRKSPVPVKPASPARLSIAKPRQKPPAKSCGTCRYLVLIAPEDDGGQCRRYPPFAITTLDGKPADRFPGVRKADIWCGEWKA